jgi:hypothetical protein
LQGNIVSALIVYGDFRAQERNWSAGLVPCAMKTLIGFQTEAPTKVPADNHTENHG